MSRKNEKTVLIRFHMNHADEQAAFLKLEMLRQQTHLSQSQLVACALNAYDAHLNEISRDQEDRIVHRVADEVTTINRQTLPGMIAGCLAGVAQTVSTASSTSIPIVHSTPSAPNEAKQNMPSDNTDDGYADIDWSFVGG